MAYYLYQLSYSQDAIKAMVANPSDREAAARKLIEALGGKLHHLFFAFGDHDVICLIEAPDDTVMMACAAAVASAGTVSGSSIVKLMTASDAMAAMTLAGKVTGAYKPPHGCTQPAGRGNFDRAVPPPKERPDDQDLWRTGP